MKAAKLVRLSLLTGVALALFTVEMHLPNPVPVPGAKLGLANIITVYAVYRCRAREAASVLLCRILLGAFLGGQAISLLYSLAGGALCLAGMLPLRRVLSQKHIWMASVLGAALHNIGQIVVAILVARTPGLIVYLPALLVSGCVSGLFTGLCAQFVEGRLRR